MTHESDFLRINTEFMGPLNIRPNKFGLGWPPPQFIVIEGETGTVREATAKDKREEIFERVSMSKITDEQIANMEHVARGADYKYVVRDGAQSE